LYCGSDNDVCIPSGTSWSNPVTVAAYGGESVTIKPNSGLRVLNFGSGQAYIIVRGFVIDATNVGYDAIQVEQPANHIRIINNEIISAHVSVEAADGGGSGINLGPFANFNEIIGNKIHDLPNLAGGSWGPHGIYVSASNNLIESNEFYNIAGYGIHQYSENGPGTASNNIVRYNIVHHTGVNVSGTVAGILLASGSESTAHNNIVYSNQVGLKAGYGSSGSAFYNNTVYRNATQGIWILDTASSTNASNNILYSNNPSIQNDGTGSLLSNNLDTDPNFVDAANLNFALQAG